MSAVKVEEICRANSWFPWFSEKYCRAISVCDVTDDLWSEHEADFRGEYKDFLSSEPAPRKFILKIFTEYFLSVR